MNGQGFRGNFYDVRTIDVSLPRLNPDSAASCPVPFEQILKHAATESDDGTKTQPSEPVFVRTARIGQTQWDGKRGRELFSRPSVPPRAAFPRAGGLGYSDRGQGESAPRRDCSTSSSMFPLKPLMRAPQAMFS